MGNLDLDHLRTWLGKSRTDEDVILARHAGLMAATVDYPAPERIRDGAPLPSLWHWIYFLEALPQRELGRDGHPARGGFLPPVPLSNRMWAGGRVFFAGSIPIGSVVRKESSILKIDHKRGRSGDLVFVTVLHELKSLHGELIVREEHDIVYREPTPPDKRPGRPRTMPRSRSSQGPTRRPRPCSSGIPRSPSTATAFTTTWTTVATWRGTTIW